MISELYTFKFDIPFVQICLLVKHWFPVGHVLAKTPCSVDMYLYHPPGRSVHIKFSVGLGIASFFMESSPIVSCEVQGSLASEEKGEV